MVPDLSHSRYQNTFEHHLGVDFKSYDDGVCEVVLNIKPEHLNIGGTVHGGIIASLLDISMSGAVTCTIIDKSAAQVVTMQMGVHFLRAGHLGDTLTARGEVMKRGSTIVYVEGSILNQSGEVIAKASGDWFVKKK